MAVAVFREALKRFSLVKARNEPDAFQRFLQSAVFLKVARAI